MNVTSLLYAHWGTFIKQKKEEVKHSVDHRDEYTNLRMLHARLDIFKPIFLTLNFIFIIFFFAKNQINYAIYCYTNKIKEKWIKIFRKNSLRSSTHKFLLFSIYCHRPHRVFLLSSGLTLIWIRINSIWFIIECSEMPAFLRWPLNPN